MYTLDSWGTRSRRGLVLIATAVRSQPRAFLGALAGSAVYAATTVATAWLLGRVTNQILQTRPGGGRPGLGVDAAWLLGAALLQVLGFVCRESLSAVMRYRLQADLRRRLVRRYATLPPAWHRQHPTGDLLSVVDADVELTWQAVRLLPSACSALLMLAAGVTAMFLTDTVFGWIGVALVVVALSFCVAYEYRAGPRVARLQAVRGRLASVAHESFEAALLVKATGREESETERFAVAAENLRQVSLAAGRVRSAFDPVMEALPSVALLATLLVGTLEVRSHQLQPGAVVQVAFLIALLALPMVSLGWIISEFPLNATAYARVQSVLSAADPVTADPVTADPVDAGPVTAAPGGSGTARTGAATVSLDQVTLVHPGAPAPSVREVTLTVAAHRRVVLVGRSGSGKSTLCSLLSGVTAPSTGAVRLDGADLRLLDPERATRRIALLPQHPFLFRDSVRANICLGLDPDDSEIWRALRLAQADGFVESLHAGLDTVIGERGHTLSGGQRQRLTLARALVRRPGLLVLDDATSAVDPLVEAAILDGLSTLRPDLTIVMASSSLAAVERADEVVYLEGGSVRDRGPHADLMTRSPAYRQLVTAYRRDQERRTDPTVPSADPAKEPAV
ncbi:ABC transporter ATP-binding protein [Streptacidiphilus sp. P02-A3a]|uniref:ABC transporter ATP-binding protein n=1 Tax=Streptacidiphilus sp. P02-A3a TaxID=2704468 RepID=UPI0015FBF19C|nr:ABC transporter ATP-binding protein [Streptacidiphilus sp. P02-A3a]QMU67378.1 ABC transporter ATP-binding protein [Streptacidiphilus sp. P02-A3a]